MSAQTHGMTLLRRFGLLSAFGIAAMAVIATNPVGQSHGANSAGAETIEAIAALSDGAAALEPAAPRNDQFLYKEIRFATGGTSQFWISIDGEHDGVMIRPDLGATVPLPGCTDRRQTDVRNFVALDSSHGCTPVRTFDASLPTDPDGFRQYLLDTIFPDSQAPEGVKSHIQAKKMISLLTFNVLTPEQRSALFRAAGQLPGITVQSGSEDADHRPGTKLSWSIPGPEGTAPYSGSVIVDDGSYELLGSSDGLTVLATAIVDAVGETS